MFNDGHLIDFFLLLTGQLKCLNLRIFKVSAYGKRVIMCKEVLEEGSACKKNVFILLKFPK